MYELIILSLLMRWPVHGYLIVKITNDMIGPWAKISSGTLYTILARLEHDGLIAVMPHEGAPIGTERRARTFAITADGRRRFYQLMLDTSSNLGDYERSFHFKLVFFDLLDPPQRLLLLNHYVNYCQTSILYLQTEMDSLTHELADQPDPTFQRNVLRVMRHMAEQWQTELEWATEIREHERGESHA